MKSMQEFDEYQVPETKKLSVTREFTIAQQKEHEFEHWVNKTAKLIDRPYFRTFQMVKTWPLEKIIERYQTVTKHNEDIPSPVLWWSLRKKDKGV